MLGDVGSGNELTWANGQSRMLLKYLLAAPGYQRTSDQVIELLWPEIDPDRGHRYLHDVLSRLRRALEPDQPAYKRFTYIVNDRDSIRLVTNHGELNSSGAWVDSEVFESLALTALDAPIECARGVSDIAHEALRLYRGSFLPMDYYSDWIELRRRQYQRLWATLVRRMAYAGIIERKFDQVALLLGKLLDDLPDDETAVYLLMIALAAAGRRGEALRVYEGLHTRIFTVLETEPRRELQALSEAIRSGQQLDPLLTELAQDSRAKWQNADQRPYKW